MNTLFEGTAQYYEKHRPVYPPKMFDDLVKKFRPDSTGRLLDIGCGPGTLSIPLSKYFEQVIALDIDPGMLEEGRKRARALAISNIQWLNESADDLNEAIGKFKLITLGASFHWINREKFSKLAFSILPEEGGMFISWTGNSLWNKDRNIWEEKVLAIIKKYLGSKRRAGDGLFKFSETRHQDVLKNAGFKRLEFRRYPSAERTMTIDDIIKSQYTNSYAAKNLFGDRVSDFEKEITAELLKINPKNQFKETHVAGCIYALKKIINNDKPRPS